MNRTTVFARSIIKPLNMCYLEAILEFINKLNQIPSPTDGEEKLIEYITRLCKDESVAVKSIMPKSFLKVAPILIGNPDAKYIFVTHCDRVQENANPLKVWNNNIQNVEGKLDNAVSLAVCLKLVLALKPQNSALLITTSEEGKLNPQIVGADPLQKTGGRGFISYLIDNLQFVKDKYFICLDVRPLDRGGVLKTGEKKKYINLGDGLVLRTSEERENVSISADTILLNIIKQCALHNDINLTEFAGSGITELGRGFERVLQPIGYPRHDYHIAWVQPPLTHYHTQFEQMSGNDIIDLCKVVKRLCEIFENFSV
jgi:putative aminopeptidase FrvX